MAARDRGNAILDASVALFARQGFAATTTRQVARAAGVSEALVFKHFPDKKALYRAILEARIAEAERAQPFDESLWKLTDEQFFFRIASNLLRRVETDDSFLRLLLRSGLEGHSLARDFHEARVVKVLAVLEKRVRQRQRKTGKGGIRPALAARLFHGMLLASLISRRVFREPVIAKQPVDEWARTVVRAFLNGIDAPPRRA